MAHSEAGRLCLEIARIANGREEVPYSEVASDDVVEQSFGTLLDTLKFARKSGLLSFEGEQLFRGKHDQVPIKLTEKGLAVKAESARAAPQFKSHAFFEGEEAMKEVAKPDGAWNWCIVGPDPDKLPLAGGGSGGIEQMTGAMGSHANTFGLLRLNFGQARHGEEVRWVYVHANMVDEDEEGRFSTVERGKAMAKGPVMEATIGKFAKIACKIEGTSKDDFNAENVIAKLGRAAGANVKHLTIENYREQLPQASPEADEAARGVEPLASLKPETIANALQHIASLKPEPMAAESPAKDVLEEIPLAPMLPTAEAKQRRKIASPKVGDTIKVRVLGKGDGEEWTDDGVILDIAKEPILLKDGITEIPVGTVRVQYNKDKRIKWVLLNQIPENIQKSKRPRPPSTWSGPLWKETHGMFTTWHKRYFELQMGSLTWWDSEDSAKAGNKIHGNITMLGLFTKRQGSVIKLTSQSCNGIVYCFDGGHDGPSDIWEKAFKEHAKFALDTCMYLEAVKMDKERAQAASEEKTEEAPAVNSTAKEAAAAA